jgi:hypothetical protein
MNYFHHGGQVTLLLKFSGLDIYQREKFIGIDEVKIACQRKVAGCDGIPFYKG